jgi:hypothetical protein
VVMGDLDVLEAAAPILGPVVALERPLAYELPEGVLRNILCSAQATANQNKQERVFDLHRHGCWEIDKLSFHHEK